MDDMRRQAAQAQKEAFVSQEAGRIGELSMNDPERELALQRLGSAGDEGREAAAGILNRDKSFRAAEIAQDEREMGLLRKIYYETGMQPEEDRSGYAIAATMSAFNNDLIDEETAQNSIGAMQADFPNFYKGWGAYVGADTEEGRGSIPAGYQLDDTGTGFAPVPGGPEDPAVKEAGRAQTLYRQVVEPYMTAILSGQKPSPEQQRAFDEAKNMDPIKRLIRELNIGQPDTSVAVISEEGALNAEQADTLEQARAKIAEGADPEVIAERLEGFGISRGLLNAR